MSEQLSQRERIEALESQVQELADALVATQQAHNRLCDSLKALMRQPADPAREPKILLP